MRRGVRSTESSVERRIIHGVATPAFAIAPDRDGAGNEDAIEGAKTCLSAFLMPLDTMHGVPRLNLPAAEGVGRQNYQF